MKKLSAILVLCFWMQAAVFSQEKIYVQTDKPYYVAGETICFRAFLLNAVTHQPSGLSRYVYVELISPDNTVVIRQQIRPDREAFFGILPLSDYITPGNYQLRAYTRFMENIGTDSFFTQSVYIAGSPDVQIEEYGGAVEAVEEGLPVDIITSKPMYKTGEEVIMKLTLPIPSLASLAVSVTDDSEVALVSSSNILNADWSYRDIEPVIAPEQSQSFSGTVKGGFITKPYAGAKVMLYAGEYAFGDVTNTDANGRFTFNGFEFPDGTQYLIEAVSKKGRKNIDIYLDSVTYPKVSVSRGKPVFYPKLSNNTYNTGARSIELPELVVKKPPTLIPYFSEPDAMITQDELELSSSADILELLDRISGVSARQGIIRIRNGFVSLLEPPRSPLVVIDGMKSLSSDDNDVYTLLQSIPVSTIKQVEVIKSKGKLAVYGYLGRGGVIEIFTKDPSKTPGLIQYNRVVVTPLGYQNSIIYSSPSPGTVYWEPNVITDANGNAGVAFDIKDTPSTYSVVIQGVTKEGQLVYCKKEQFIKVE
jgi:hypothetical protein